MLYLIDYWCYLARLYIMKPISKHIKISNILAIMAFSLVLSGCGSSPYRSSKAAESKQEIIQTAQNLLGVKYRYGGTSPSQGFDCSGFVQYSHRLAGIYIPRTTGQQYKAAKRISRRYLKQGDLVFFKTAMLPLLANM